jgi:hypothetical protein
VGLVSDAGGNRQLLPRYDCDAVWPRPYFEDTSRFQAACIEPSQARCAAVGYENHPVVGGNTRRFGKIRQRCDVFAAIVVDDLDAATAGMRHKNPAARRIESAVVERAAGGAGYRNGGDCLE